MRIGGLDFKIQNNKEQIRDLRLNDDWNVMLIIFSMDDLK